MNDIILPRNISCTNRKYSFNNQKNFEDKIYDPPMTC